MIPDDQIPIWTFRPNWDRRVLERLSWLTDVKASKTGAESRRSVRIDPRRQVDFTPLLANEDRAYFDMAMIQRGSSDWLVPVWWDAAWVAGGLGTTTLTCETAGRAFVVGDYALLLGDYALEYQRVQISAVDVSGLTLSGAASDAFPNGAKVYPLRRAYLSDAPKLDRLTSRVATSQIRFVETYPATWPTTLAMDTYAGFPVLARTPNWRDGLDINYAFLQDIYDNLAGRRAAIDTAGRGVHRQAFNWLLQGRAEHDDFRSLLNTLRGRQKGAWVPSWGEDLLLATATSIGATTLPVRRTGLVDLGAPFDGRRHIEIVLNTGEVYRREITGVASGGPSVETITVAAIPVALTPNSVKRISFMDTMRLDQDDVEIEHHTDEISECKATFRAFPDIRVEDPNNAYAIADAEMSDSPCGVATTLWAIHLYGTEQGDGVGGGGEFTLSELRFLLGTGGGIQPGAGSPAASETIGDPGTYHVTFLYDGDVNTKWHSNSAGAWVGFNFSSPQQITAVSLRARNDEYFIQAARSFYVRNSSDGGATWTTVAYCVAAPWTQGMTQVFDLTAALPDEDQSHLDEVGGHQFYAIRNTGPAYDGGSSAIQNELFLGQSGENIGLQFQRMWYSGVSFTINPTSSSTPFDNEPPSDQYFSIATNGYVLVDLGYKRTVDEVGVIMRQHNLGGQGLKQYELLAGDAMDIGSMTVIKTVNDIAGPNPPGANAVVKFSVP